jgi:hypothetical protein
MPRQPHRSHYAKKVAEMLLVKCVVSKALDLAAGGQFKETI